MSRVLLQSPYPAPQSSRFPRTPPTELIDLAAGAAEIARHYAAKWQHADVLSVVSTRNWLAAQGQEGLDLQPEELAAAAARLRRQNFVDDTGVCPMLLQAAVDAAPAMSSRCFDQTIASTPACSSVSVRAPAFGKKSPTPLPGAVRLIMPMTTDWRVLDVVISERVQAWIATLGPLPDGCMECWVRGAGAPQAALGARLVVGKSLDDFFSGGIVADRHPPVLRPWHVPGG